MNRKETQNKFVKNILLLLLFSVSTIYSSAQTTNYPIQVYTQLTPPYTPYVPSYYTGSQQKLKVTLINTDMQQPLLQVYLKMKITSSSFSMVTPTEVFTPRIELHAGVPFQLSGQDLEVYFKKENLRIGNGQNEFYRTQLLPDNFYRFNFEVYEANTNKLLSNTKMGFAQVMIAAGDPPIPTMPKLGTAIPESNIPFIFFSWTPRHMNSVAAAYGTEYEFTLVEIFDKQVAPDNAFLYSKILYTETVKSTSFTHTVAQPILVPGMRYAWRVKAVAKDGLEDANVFKNDGYSAVSWFDYTVDCKPVQTFGAVYENSSMNITWVNTDAIDYTVEYRTKGSQRWYTGIISDGSCTLYNLKFGQEYEYRIGARCTMNDAFLYSSEKGFRMPDKIEKGPNCGLMPDINLTNQVATKELKAGLPILVGDFPVFITKVSGSGRFTGEGYVGIPYLKGTQIAVTFKDIVVNTDNRLISGFFETKYDTKNNNMLFDVDQALTGGKGVGDIRSDEAKAAFIVDYSINPNIKALPVKADGTKDDIKDGKDYIISKGGNGKYTFILTDNKGNGHKVESETMPTTIEDKDGNVFEINEKGEVTQVSGKTEIKLNPNTKNTPRKDIAVLEFASIENKTRYALDQYKDIYAKVTEYYLQYKPTNEDMIASAKFMLPGASDEIFVRIKESHKDKGFDPTKVHFVTANGKEYQAKYNDKDGWNVTLVGSEAGDGQAVFAVQQMPDGSYATLARLNTYSYDAKEVPVVLVPVNGFDNGFDTKSVEQGLNEIYGKIGVNVSVEKATDNFVYTPINGKAFNVTGSGLFSSETDDMKSIQAAYKASLGEKYRNDVLYLFIIPEVTGADNVAGDMPHGKQFGYLFKGADTRTIAHEIGHGAFNLEHPFDRTGRNNFTRGNLPDNLMDYGTGTSFSKIEWDATRVPGLAIGILQTDEDAMEINKNALVDLNDNRDFTFDMPLDIFNFFSPDGRIVTLPEDYKSIAFTTNFPNNIPTGVLTRFTTSDGDVWAAAYTSDFRQFLGYRSQNASDQGNKNLYYQSIKNYSSADAIGIHVIIGLAGGCHIYVKNMDLESYLKENGNLLKKDTKNNLLIHDLNFFKSLPADPIGDPVFDKEACLNNPDDNNFYINDNKNMEIATLEIKNGKYNRNSVNIPYSTNWINKYRSPAAKFWYKIDDGNAIGNTYLGRNVQRPIYVEVNSPVTVFGMNLKYEVSGETRYFDELLQSEIISNRSIKDDGRLDGLKEAYSEVINKWKIINYKPTADPRYQTSSVIEMLARGIMNNGALNPKVILELKSDDLYFDGKKYYNSDEASYWLFGYIANKNLNFATRLHGQAFAIQHLNATKYFPGTLSFNDSMEDATWLINAFNEGWNQAYRVTNTMDMNPTSLYDPYVLNGDFLTNGTDGGDIIEVAIWVYPTAGAARKITVKVTRNALITAYVNWQVQIMLRMLCGMTFKEAAADVDYADVLWEGLTSSLTSDKEVMALECFKAGVEEFQKTRELNMGVGTACIYEIIQYKAIKKIIGDEKSICGKYLYENLKKHNHSKSELLRKICIAFNCESDVALEIMRLMPETALNTLIDDIKE